MARAALEDANSGRSSAEQEAARLCTQVEDWRAFAGAAETGRREVSAFVPPVSNALLQWLEAGSLLFQSLTPVLLHRCLVKRSEPHPVTTAPTTWLHALTYARPVSICVAVMTVSVLMAGGADSRCCHGSHGGGPRSGRSSRAARGVAEGILDRSGVCACSSRGSSHRYVLQTRPEPCLPLLPLVAADPIADL